MNKFGNKDYIIYRINQELSLQFITYKQNILKLLKKYIEEYSKNLDSDNMSFVGTNNFNLVWEDVCSVVMDNCINKSIEELGLNYSKTDKNLLISEVISKPKWQHEESGKEHTAPKTLIPDIVTIKDDSLSIFDAKYYKIKLDNSGVNNQPGVGDITKQYLYELSYIDFAKENNLFIKKNAFLIPTDAKDEIKIGTAIMDIFHNFSDIEINDIEVILKPCEKMYEKYLEI